MTGGATDTELVLPIHAETLSVERRTVETGRVRISTKTYAEDVTIRETLARDHAEIDRRTIGEYVAEPPRMREEGDYLIIPVVEEVLVVEKRLFLKEEIRIRRTRTTQLHEETVTLRKEEAVIERETAHPPHQPLDNAEGNQQAEDSIT